MREINNNREVGKVQKPEIKHTEPEIVEPQITSPEKEIKDLSSPTEVSGRSLVNKADNLKEDVAFVIAHPKSVEKANKFFDIVYEQLKASGNKDAYPEACAITQKLTEEFELDKI